MGYQNMDGFQTAYKPLQYPSVQTPAPITGYNSPTSNSVAQSFNMDSFNSLIPQGSSKFDMNNVLPYGSVAPTGIGIPNQGASLGGAAPRGFMDNMLGWKDKDGSGSNGWGGLALQTGQGLMNAYLGMQMYGVAKDTLASNKEQFAKNYGAQVATTNAKSFDQINSRSGITQAEKDALYAQRKIGG